MPAAPVFSGFTVFVTFVVVFRTGHATKRYMDAGGLCLVFTSCWFDATSAFFSSLRCSKADTESVTNLKHVMIRYVSMINALCFVELQGTRDGACSRSFEVINARGLPASTLVAVRDSPCRVETI